VSLATRRLAVGLVSIATFAALAGCSLLGPVAPKPTADPGPAPQGLEEFYAQNLTWDDCGGGSASQVECTTVKAPISWAAPDEGAIDLAVVRHVASGTSKGSVLVNPGGPGGSGWDYVYYQGENTLSAGVAENYDIVGWDPRGVGRSTPVTCYTDVTDRDEVLYGTFDEPYDTEGWIDELTTVQEGFAAACEANTGALLANIDTASNARDLDLLRALMGDAKLNYVGFSYGTFIGSMYAELFPQNVGKMVLDGAVDPLLSDFDSLKVQMAGFDSAFRAYLQFCLDSADCPFTGTVDTAATQARSVLDTVDAQRLVNADGRVLDSATLGTAIASNLYTESYWPDMTDMFNALRQGDASIAFMNADNYNSRNPDGTYSGNSFEVYTAVTCVDGDFKDDPKSTLERIAEIDAAAPILGKYFAYDDFAVLDTTCSNWPVPQAELPTVYDAEGAAPILVIGTSNDPATPYAWAQSLASQLSSGVLVSYEGEGHTVYNSGVACIDDTVEAYFLEDKVPAADPMC